MTNPIDWAKNELHDIVTTLEKEGHHLADRARAAFDALKAAAPQLEHDAVTDAEQVAETAATQGLVPAEQETVKDVGELATEAGHDVATAVETPATPSA